MLTRRAPVMQLLLALMLLAATHPDGACAVAAPHSRSLRTDVATVHSRMIAAMLPMTAVPHVDAEVTAIVASQLPNGTWADVNYDDPNGRSWWDAGVHLQRALLLATAWHTNVSAHHGDAAVASAGDRAMEWWLHNNPPNTNWWWNQFGTPRIVGKYLLLRPPNATMLAAAEPVFARTPMSKVMSWTGCNRVWACTVRVMHGLLTGNDTEVAQSYAVAHTAIGVKDYTGDGLQSDGSFHQHGPQLYTGWGYGVIYSTNVLALESYAFETGLAMSDDLWETFAHLVLDGQQLGTRGPNIDYSSSGRLMTYFAAENQWGVNHGHYHYFAAFTPFDLAFPRFKEPFATPLAVHFAPLLPSVPASRPRQPEFQAFYDRMHGVPSAPPLSLCKHFHDSDYLVQHRPGYMASLRMFSNRTINTECGNGENLQGKELADGLLNVVQSGREFENVFPVWQWTHLPGTTELQIPGKVYNCSDVHDVTHASWVGGLSVDGVGVAAFNFSRGHASHLSAHRAWFFSDVGVIAVGADISSAPLPGSGGVPYPVSTSLDQRPATTDVLVLGHGQAAPSRVLPSQTLTTEADWVWHDGIAYVALSNLGMRVSVANTVQNGSWAAITQGPDTPMSRRVFRASIEHGTPVASTADYAYAVLPGLGNESDIAAGVAAARQTFELLVHGSTVQAACLERSDIDATTLLAAFWPADEHSLLAANPDALRGATGDCTSASVDIASFVAVQAYRNGTAVVSVANPAVEARPLTMTVTVAAVLGGEGCVAVNATHTSVTFALPEGNDAGATVSRSCGPR